MPSLIWSVDPVLTVQAFESTHRGPDAGALILNAVWAVDSLYYLFELDTEHDLSAPLVRGHRPDVVEVAHARWATGTCITALDLCAAGLARAFGAASGPHECDISDLDPNGRKMKKAVARRRKMPPAALLWLDAVIGDPDYAAVISLRHTLTHSRVRRHFTMPRQRLQIDDGVNRMDVPSVLTLSSETATRHVTSLLSVLPSL